MKRSLIIALLSLVVGVSYASYSNILVDEIIRRKIENLPVFTILNKTYEIYCIPSVREVYLANDFEPYWQDDNEVHDIISMLEASREEGLNPDDYHLSDIKELLYTENLEDKANLDIILSDAFLLYISHFLAGKVNPVTIDAEWHVVKTDKNPIRFFYQADSVPIPEVIHTVMPQSKNYQALKDELKFYFSLTNKEQPEVIRGGQILKPGMNDERIPSVRAMLAFYSHNSALFNLTSTFYDDTLKQDVIHFQAQHGLEALGTIGPQTLEMMNIPLEQRIMAIKANLERQRWLPQQLPNYYLMVNIVNFQLDVFENNEIVRTHKVIVGKPYRKTPVFSSTMQYLVLNPTWTVPPTILKEDLIPEVRKNVNALATKNIRVYNPQGIRLEPDSVDWSSKKVFGYTYRQEAGKSNALGAVKFMFPNSFNVYLHDTPSRELFERTERAFSSGCIRVHQPLELAEYLLRDQTKYNLNEIKRIVASNETQTIVLKTKPQVYLFYLTAWVDEPGGINFRKDIYERDKKLIRALAEKPVYDIE